MAGVWRHDDLQRVVYRESFHRLHGSVDEVIHCIGFVHPICVCARACIVQEYQYKNVVIICQRGVHASEFKLNQNALLNSNLFKLSVKWCENPFIKK